MVCILGRNPGGRGPPGTVFGLGAKGGQQPLAISLFGKRFQPFSSRTPLWPQGMRFGHAGLIVCAEVKISANNFVLEWQPAVRRSRNNCHRRVYTAERHVQDGARKPTPARRFVDGTPLKTWTIPNRKRAKSVLVSLTPQREEILAAVRRRRHMSTEAG